MSKRLLIVDDSEIDREILKNMLFLDFEVEAVENGYAGVERAMKAFPKLDGILLDLYMPVMDGFHVMELLKEHNIDIPVVIITAESTTENLIKTIPYNVVDFICKPFESEIILPRLKGLFGSL